MITFLIVFFAKWSNCDSSFLSAETGFLFFFICACLSPDTDLDSLSLEHLGKKQQNVLVIFEISLKNFLLPGIPLLGNR
jgi:hypothetical protein